MAKLKAPAAPPRRAPGNWQLPKLTRFFTAWSFSRLKQWRQCPAQAAYKHLHRLPEPDSEATARGTMIHNLAAQAVTGKHPLGQLPPELALFKPEFKLLRAAKALVEADWTFTAQWAQTRWDDWKNAWVRMKVDAHFVEPKAHVVHVRDHKTGKNRYAESDFEQGKLYATGGLLAYPHAKRVDVRFLYLDHGETEGDEYPRKALPALLKYWEGEAKPMLADRRFAPRPGRYCTYCPYSVSKGGPCKY